MYINCIKARRSTLGHARQWPAMMMMMVMMMTMMMVTIRKTWARLASIRLANSWSTIGRSLRLEVGHGCFHFASRVFTSHVVQQLDWPLKTKYLIQFICTTDVRLLVSNTNATSFMSAPFLLNTTRLLFVTRWKLGPYLLIMWLEDFLIEAWFLATSSFFSPDCHLHKGY